MGVSSTRASVGRPCRDTLGFAPVERAREPLPPLVTRSTGMDGATAADPSPPELEAVAGACENKEKVF